MSVADYVAVMCRHILEAPHVVSHSLAYEDRPPIGAIVNGTVKFADGSQLHIKEFLRLRPSVTRLKYAYHYASPTQSLIFRYDNARDPAARHFSTYPDHRHTPDSLLPSSGPDLASVLREAATCVRRSSR
ncbi:MAG: hypothetical protein GDA68_03920 [Nitrospira sp. CR2.1]|nr:hypothetical protein [Nitrospira sp. CR2.1]